MKEKDKKIAIPTDDEVARYGSEEQGDNPDSKSDSGAESNPGGGSSELESLRAELAECQDKLLRAQAECANISRRLTQQHAASLKLAGMDMARSMLIVLDSFDRLMETIADVPQDDPIAQGARLIYEQFRSTLDSQGVKPMASVGEHFDPTRHEAMMQDRQSDAPPGTVTIEMQRGYMMGDRVLRPAKVAVAASDEDASSPDPTQDESGSEDEPSRE